MLLARTLPKPKSVPEVFGSVLALVGNMRRLKQLAILLEKVV
jgi:hypothetical protein